MPSQAARATRRRRLLLVVGLIALVAAGLYGWTKYGWRSSKEDTAPDSLPGAGDVGLDDLARDLRSGQFEVQLRAAAGFRDHQTHEAAERVAAVLRDDSRVQTKVAATRAMTFIGVPAVEPLGTILRDVRLEPVTRYSAATALAEIRDPRAIDWLIPVLAEESDVQVGATVALIDFRQSAVEPLIPVLRSENPRLRERAAWILVMIGDGRAAQPILNRVRANDMEVVSGAYRYLIAIGLQDAEAPLVRALREHKSDSSMMADEFYSSGNQTLQRAATEWAAQRKVPLQRTGEKIPWGKGGRFSLG